MPMRSIAAAVVAVGLLVASVSGCADDDAGGATRSTMPPEVRYHCATSVNQPDQTVPIEVVEAGVCGYDDGLGQVTYGVVVQNVGTETLRDVNLSVDVGGSGVTGTGRSVPHYLYVLAPGEQIGVGYRSPQGSTSDELTLQVRATQQPVVEQPEADATLAVSGVATAVEEETRTTDFTLTSSYPFPLQRIEVFVIYRDAEGTIVGGEQDFVERVETQGTVTHTTTSTYVNPAATEAVVFVNEHPFVPWPGGPVPEGTQPG
jgi:hypothetical protein